jgi:hypothetical protein
MPRAPGSVPSRLNRPSTAILSACSGQVHAIAMSRVGREGHGAPLSDPEDRATSGSAAVRNESSLGLACMVIRGGGRGYVQALHGLTGDPGDEVEVLVEMQHRQPGKFSSRSDDQVRY